MIRCLFDVGGICPWRIRTYGGHLRTVPSCLFAQGPAILLLYCYLVALDLPCNSKRDVSTRSDFPREEVLFLAGLLFLNGYVRQGTYDALEITRSL